MNINELIELGKEGKLDELEAMREKMSNELIASVKDPEQAQRLAQLHFKAKNIRYKYKNPLTAACKSNELMIQELGKLNAELVKLTNIIHPPQG